METPKISAVVLTKNEEANIADCLKSLSWCNEVIVIDDNSTDKTTDIAKKLKATVIPHGLDLNFGQQRNFALSKVKNEWTLFVDADERVSELLQKEIKQALENSKVNGYYIPRRDSMWGKELLYGEQGNMKLVRLGKKTKGEWVGRVHETWNILGETDELKNPMIHFPHQSLAEFLKEINIYSSIRAKELFDNGATAGFWSILAYPKVKFLYNYGIKLGFLDGMQGFVAAILMSMHSFLVRSKLWQLTNNK